MKRDQLAFLLAGLAFGFLLGFGVFFATSNAPQAPTSSARVASDVPSPAGPAAPTEVAGGGGAPMMAEIGALKQRVAADPKDVAALTRLGNLFQDVQMWPQALEWYDRALQARPDDPDLLTDSGVCLQASGKLEESLERFRRAFEGHPRHWQSMYNFVVVAGLKLGRYADADSVLRRLEGSGAGDATQVAELRHALDQTRGPAAAPAGGSPR